MWRSFRSNFIAFRLHLFLQLAFVRCFSIGRMQKREIECMEWLWLIVMIIIFPTVVSSKLDTLSTRCFARANRSDTAKKYWISRKKKYFHIITIQSGNRKKLSGNSISARILELKSSPKRKNQHANSMRCAALNCSKASAIILFSTLCVGFTLFCVCYFFYDS